MPLFQFGGTYTFQNAIYYLERIGLRDVILPFFLIFTVLFAVLQRVQLFGKESKKYNIVIALVIGFLVVIPHIMGAYPPGIDVVLIMNQALPEIALLIIVIIMVMLMIGLLGGGEYKRGPWTGIAALVAVLGLIIIFVRAFYPAFTPGWLSFLDDPGFQALIIVLIVFGLIVWFVTSEPGEKKPSLEEFFFGKKP